MHSPAIWCGNRKKRVLDPWASAKKWILMALCLLPTVFPLQGVQSLAFTRIGVAAVDVFEKSLSVDAQLPLEQLMFRQKNGAGHCGIRCGHFSPFLVGWKSTVLCLKTPICLPLIFIFLDGCSSQFRRVPLYQTGIHEGIKDPGCSWNEINGIWGISNNGINTKIITIFLQREHPLEISTACWKITIRNSLLSFPALENVHLKIPGLVISHSELENHNSLAG